MWVKLGTTLSTVPDRIGETFQPQSNEDVMLKAGWRLGDTAIMPVPNEGTDILSWVYAQDPADPKRAIIQIVTGSIADREAKEAASAAEAKATSDKVALADTELDIEKFEAAVATLPSDLRMVAELRWLINAARRR